MPQVIAIRLHPETPTTGTGSTSPPSFDLYLAGLSITAVDLSLTHPTPPGDPTDVNQVIGTASVSSSPNPTIVQHLSPPPPISILIPAGTPQAVATAAILVNSPATPLDREYLEPDVVLHITRGTQTVAIHPINYNAVVSNPATFPVTPAEFQALEASLYVALPSPAQDLNPNEAFLTLPPDGSPPSFQDLLAAVMAVVRQDPSDPHTPPLADPPDPDAVALLSSLSVAQCRQIANEIVYNRRLDPNPVPSPSLEELYTIEPGESSITSSLETARQTFESALLQYDATHDARVNVVTNFIAALSAAIANEVASAGAPHAGLAFPVRPDLGTMTPTGKIAESLAVLGN